MGEVFLNTLNMELLVQICVRLCSVKGDFIFEYFVYSSKSLTYVV